MNLNNKKVLFQGDSITDMARGRNVWDQNHLYGHSYVFLIASFFECEEPEKNITFYNRGNSGDRSVDVLSRWEEDAVALKPDIVNLLVGINDVLLQVDNRSGTDAQEYEKVLTEIILKTKQELADAELILMEPFCFVESAKDEYKEIFSEEIPKRQAIVRNLANKYHCLFIPLQEDFNDALRKHPDFKPDHWIWDGIHPTAAGQRLIAKKWISCVVDTDE